MNEFKLHRDFLKDSLRKTIDFRESAQNSFRRENPENWFCENASVNHPIQIQVERFKTERLQRPSSFKF